MTKMAGGILLLVATLESASFLVREHAAGALSSPCLNAGHRSRLTRACEGRSAFCCAYGVVYQHPRALSSLPSPAVHGCREQTQDRAIPRLTALHAGVAHAVGEILPERLSWHVACGGHKAPRLARSAATNCVAMHISYFVGWHVLGGA